MNEKYQNEKIEKISNHVEVMNREFGELKISNSEEHATIKTDLDWLKKHYYIIASASITGLIGVIINLIK